MTCSPAQLAANRANARRSTGPRTTAGKAAARLNACRHGLAGAGDLVGPGEDAALIAERAAAFAAELGAIDPVGRVLAHRAALLSVRMERAADRDLAAVAATVAEAQARFDQDRADALAELVAELETAEVPAGAIAALERDPAGVAHLLAATRELRDALRGGCPLAAQRARRRLGRDESAPADDLLRLLDADLARLAGRADDAADATRAIAAARVEAGILARFDPSPAANLARRYEAAAERGMYRALRTIAELRRTHAQDPTPAPPPIPAIPPAPPAARDARPTAPRPVAPPALGSFRAGPAASGPAVAGTRAEPADLPPIGNPRRQDRPDLRKLAASRR